MTKKVLTDKEAFDIIVKHVEKRAYGEVSEWFMVPVLKTGVVSPTVGSNPTFSAVERTTHVKEDIRIQLLGEVPKWLKGLPWKGSRSLIAARGFKSLLLRLKLLQKLF